MVDFIVRSVDEVLKTEFNLENGLIDDLDTGHTKSEKQRQKEKEVHKVQILDPATGTGIFLASTIKFIKENYWVNYSKNLE